MFRLTLLVLVWSLVPCFLCEMDITVPRLLIDSKDGDFIIVGIFEIGLIDEYALFEI